MIVTSFFNDFLAAGQDGLHLLVTAVIPVLFPFFVLTSLILNLLPTNRPWLVAILAYFSGYPNGCRLTQTLYDQKHLSVSQAQHLSIITSTPSPFFVIATVGVVFLHNIQDGIAIFLCAVLGAIINGFLWRKHPTIAANNTPITTAPPPTFFEALTQALTNATSTIINVCGVIFFFYLSAQLLHLPTFLAGLLEMTTGAAATTNLIFLQFFVTFGGISVAMQHQLFLPSFQVKLRTYFAYKLTHAILACGLIAIYILFLQ